jgi:hypothetical protein
VIGLIPSKERNQFPNADHFLTVIGEAWLRRNKPPNDGNKAFGTGPFTGYPDE